MRAVLLCGEQLDGFAEGLLKRGRGETLFIATESELFKQIAQRYPAAKTEFLPVYSEENYETESELAKTLVRELTARAEDESLRDLPLITINTLFEVYTRMIVSVKEGVDRLIEHYGIDSLVLYGGNRRVPFYPINLAEGERPFRFLYKRAWFLNPLMNDLYADTLQIEWKRKDSAAVLHAARWARVQLLNAGKIAASCKKARHAAKRPIEKTSKDTVGIVIRSKQQANGMISVYREINAREGLRAIVLLYENYKNSVVAAELEKLGMDYVDLRAYTSAYSVLHAYASVCMRGGWDKREITLSDPKIGNIRVETKALLRELKVTWWDSRLMSEAFSAALHEKDLHLRGLVNAETYNWVSATQGLWAKAHGISSAGVEFVWMGVRPKTFWVDHFFLMAQDDLDRFARANTEGGYSCAGPVCYEHFFNASRHRDGELKTVSVFTQPDFFRNTFFDIIDDLLSIRDETEANWQIVIKLHPREHNAEEFRQRYGKNDFVSVFLTEEDSNDVLIRSDLAVGLASMTLQQSVLIGTPAVSANYIGYDTGGTGIFRYGVIPTVKNKAELRRFLKDFGDWGTTYRENRKRYFDECMKGYCGKGAALVADYFDPDKRTMRAL